MDLQHTLCGNLDFHALPLHDPIIVSAGIFGIIFVIAIAALITYTKKWSTLWNDWVCTVDHKRIGIMYLILALVMLIRGIVEALMMRGQQAIAAGHNLGFIPTPHYDQLFTAHGVIMIFFMAMAFLFGLINLVVPLQIGARDVAFPYLNSLSFWLAVAGAMLVNISMLVGHFAGTGWLAYPPLSEIQYSPGVGVDYYLWALSISGIGTLLTGINFFVTIIRMRCPGMTMMKMPIFTWSVLCTMALVIIAFPILSVTLGMLWIDRFFGAHFFTMAFGGNAMLYVNLIWSWGHPEVYILMLPVFGIYSEIVATFCKKRLFGYTSMVWATAAITALSFIVWLHHFFTMGAGPEVNAFFGIATMIISIPTGVKIFNWLATIYRGRVEYHSCMLWTFGFLITFTIGGMTGVLMAVPGIDFQVHNSLFLVAHFHNMIIGGVVFGLFAGLTYWWPKAFGFKLNETLGKWAFWLWFVGFYVAFMPLYVLGLMGMTRRLSHYPSWTDWQPLLIVAAFGALIILCGVACQVLQVLVSIRRREEYRDITGDPWDGRTLEWTTTSPPPFYNFAVEPTVETRDAFWDQKEKGIKPSKEYSDIHMPCNTSVGFLIAVFSNIFGFGIVWHIYWMIGLSALLILITVIKHSYQSKTDYYVTKAEVEVIEERATA